MGAGTMLKIEIFWFLVYPISILRIYKKILLDASSIVSGRIV